MGVIQKRLLQSVMGLLLVTATMDTSFAEDWFLYPALTLGGEYNSNVYLSVDNPTGNVWGTIVSPSFSAGKETGISLTSVKALFNFIQYSDNSNLDRNEQLLDLTSRYRASEKSDWSVNGRIMRDTVLRDIVVGQNVISLTDDAEDTDVALVAARIKRSRLTLRPQWRYQISEKWSSRIRYKFTDVSYENVAGSQLTDYRQHYGSIDMAYKYTERSDLFAETTIADYQAQGNATDSRTYGLNVGLHYLWTNRLDGAVALGYRTTSQKNVVGSTSDSNGFVLSGNLQRTSELGLLSLLVRRAVDPSGAGSVQNDQVRLRWHRKLSEKAALNFRGRYLRSQSLSVNNTNKGRNYVELSPLLEWMLTRTWSINGSYEYRHQKRDNITGSADSNAVFMGVSYSPGKR